MASLIQFHSGKLMWGCGRDDKSCSFLMPFCPQYLGLDTIQCWDGYFPYYIGLYDYGFPILEKYKT